jgi:hypothetical protein
MESMGEVQVPEVTDYRCGRSHKMSVRPHERKIESHLENPDGKEGWKPVEKPDPLEEGTFFLCSILKIGLLKIPENFV